MKKAFSLAILFVLAGVAAAQKGPHEPFLGRHRFIGSLDQAVAKAKSENKFVLIEFYSNG